MSIPSANAPRRAAVYARFSSDKQDERSIDDQVALCQAYAARHGLMIVGEPYADYAVSGSSVHGRFAFQRLVEDAKRGLFDVLLTEDLDRVSRNQADVAALYERLTFVGATIVTVADGAINEMHIGLKGTMSALFIKTLAIKTHRGQQGRVREGKNAGGRCYGYRPVLGKPGELEIVEAEADVVRRIFRDTLAGASPRALAATLNREGVPSPKGGKWNATTIRGSAARATGILRNALYAGRVVWNRQHFVRDPDTGKRVSRVNGASAIMTAETPALRIVDAATWSAIAAQLVERAQPQANGRPMRARHMLSGLMRCGKCGGTFTVAGGRGPGPQFTCSTRREKGTCDNSRFVAGAKVEARILAAIETHLLDPDAVAEMMKNYVAGRAQAEAGRRQERQRSEKRLGAITRELGRLVDAIAQGVAAGSVRDRILALEEERRGLESAAEASPPPSVVTVHPGVIERYRRLVAGLRAQLSSAPEAAAVVVAVRELIDQVTIYPHGDPRGRDIELVGQLAALLRPPAEKLRRTEGLVAGTRFKPFHPAGARMTVAA